MCATFNEHSLQRQLYIGRYDTKKPKVLNIITFSSGHSLQEATVVILEYSIFIIDCSHSVCLCACIVNLLLSYGDLALCNSECGIYFYNFFSEMLVPCC